LKANTGAMENNPGAVNAVIGAMEINHGSMESHPGSLWPILEP